MKTKTYEIEVVQTSRVKVVLPESYASEEWIKDWEEGLWKLEKGVTSIAEYAARMAVNFPHGNHDGVGVMLTNSFGQPNYEEDPFKVVAVVDEEDIECEVVEESGWEEVCPST